VSINCSEYCNQFGTEFNGYIGGIFGEKNANLIEFNYVQDSLDTIIFDIENYTLHNIQIINQILDSIDVNLVNTIDNVDDIGFVIYLIWILKD